MAQYIFFFFICPLRCLFSKGWRGCLDPPCLFWSLSPGKEGLCRGCVHRCVCVSVCVRKGEGPEKKAAGLALSQVGLQ